MRLGRTLTAALPASSTFSLRHLGMRCRETRITKWSRPRPDFEIERPTALSGSAKIGDTGGDLTIQAV